MKSVTALIGAAFVFAVVFAFTFFIADHIVEGMPTRYSMIALAVCLLIAAAAGFESFRASKGKMRRANTHQDATTSR